MKKIKSLILSFLFLMGTNHYPSVKAIEEAPKTHKKTECSKISLGRIGAFLANGTISHYVLGPFSLDDLTNFTGLTIEQIKFAINMSSSDKVCIWPIRVYLPESSKPITINAYHCVPTRLLRGPGLYSTFFKNMSEPQLLRDHQKRLLRPVERNQKIDAKVTPHMAQALIKRYREEEIYFRVTIKSENYLLSKLGLEKNKPKKLPLMYIEGTGFYNAILIDSVHINHIQDTFKKYFPKYIKTPLPSPPYIKLQSPTSFYTPYVTQSSERYDSPTAENDKFEIPCEKNKDFVFPSYFYPDSVPSFFQSEYN